MKRETLQLNALLIGIIAPFILTASAFFATAQAALDGPGSGLVGWWKFDEGSGTVAADSSGNDYHGTLQGTTLPTWTSGKVGGALLFNGNDGYVAVGYHAFTNFTLSVWVNSSDVPSTNNNTENITSGFPDSILRFVSIYAQKFSIYDGAGARLTKTVLQSNTWYHVAVSFDSSIKRVRLYVNGALEYDQSGLSTYSNGIITQIGSMDGTANFFKGMIDDVRIYNRVLSDSEVSDLYNLGSGSIPPDTTAPSVPSGLSALAVSNSQINLSWAASTDNVGVIGYNIYRNGSLIATTNVLQTTYSDTGLSANASYIYTVSAYDAANNQSAQSSPVSATTQSQSTLTVSKFGTGQGTVTGTGISCGSNCSETADYGTRITLTATPTSGSFFAGWSGACSGTGSCTVTLSSNTNVTATFNISSPTEPWTLRGGPYEIENLGSVFGTASPVGTEVILKLGNEYHFIKGYGVTPYYQMVDVNFTTGESRVVNGTPGAFWMNALHPNGKLYTGTEYSNFFNEYDPQTGAFRNIGLLEDGNGSRDVMIGDDNAVYIGECCTGLVQRYDPSVGILERGIHLDPNGGTYQYAWTVGADSRYTFALLGEVPWYLGIYDRQNKTSALYFKEAQDGRGQLFKGADGGWYYVRTTSTADISGSNQKYYRLVNGAPVEITAAQAPASLPTELGVYNLNTQGVSYIYGYWINMDEAFPDSLNNGTVHILWKNPNDPNDSWHPIDVPGLLVSPVAPKRIIDIPGTDEFYISTNDYGPLLRYNTATRTTIRPGYPLMSVYDLLLDGNDLYLGGYHSAIKRYAINQPWTLTPSNNSPENTTINPLFLPVRYARYFYYLAKGADGLIYMGLHQERDDVGGYLAWYDPQDGSYGNLRAPFIAYDVCDLITILGGTKIVYSAEGGRLFVFDPVTKTIEKTVDLPVGISGHIVEAEPGVVVGVGTASDGKSYMYKINMVTGELLYNLVLPGKAFQNIPFPEQRLVMGPDKHLWAFIDNNLYRIDPADGSLQSIITLDSARNVTFKGGDIYFYCASSNITDLSRIRNILVYDQVNSYGDVSGDGNVSAYDAALAAQYAVGLITLTPEQIIRADVSGGGEVSAYDAALIAQRAVGLISKFPVEG